MNLTSLGNVKAWLLPKGAASTDDDALLKNLITQLSGATLNYLERPCLTRRTYTELRSGVGNQVMLLRNWPVVSITSLQVGTRTVSAAASFGAAGYTLQTWDGTSAGLPQELSLVGSCFDRGNNNVQIVYDAGYCVLDYAATISTEGVVTLTSPYGSWVQDDGVSYATGGDLVKVNTAPAAGQYMVSVENGVATYNFNTADASKGVLIDYSYIPAALEQGVIEWIGERYRYKDRIGQVSRSLNGNETAAYSLKGVPDYLEQVFSGYKKFLPL